jgi:hypothetical protein
MIQSRSNTGEMRNLCKIVIMKQEKQLLASTAHRWNCKVKLVREMVKLFFCMHESILGRVEVYQHPVLISSLDGGE